MLGRLKTFIQKDIVTLQIFIDMLFYNKETGMVFLTEKEALQHYLTVGAASGLAPNAYFDADWYRAAYSIEGGPEAPFLDFARNGQSLRRNPSNRFDMTWYQEHYPDVVQNNIHPLAHYIKNGRVEGRYPTFQVKALLETGLFDSGYYSMQACMSFKNNNTAIEHYINIGCKLGLNPNPYFDTNWYYKAYPEVKISNINPLIDFYYRVPKFERNPSELFDCQWYINRYSDIQEVAINPLLHYINFGREEGRYPSPFSELHELPIRYSNIFVELLPHDGEVRFEHSTQVHPIREEDRIYCNFTSAFEQANQTNVATDRRQIFPPKPYYAKFSNVGIIGGSRLILKDAQIAYSDEIDTFQNAENWSVRPYYFSLGKDGQLRFPVTRSYADRIVSGIHLMHEYATNYFHMITEVLPRMIIIDDTKIDAKVPLLIQDGMHENIVNLIKMMNVDNREIINLKKDKLYYVENLIYLSDVSSIQDIYIGKRHPENTALNIALISRVVRRILDAVKHERITPWRRVYARRGARYRGLLNENRVEEILLAAGFEIVELNGLSLKAQIEIFSQAKSVVAPTGAALTNMVWCQPGTQISVLAGDHEAMPIEIWDQLATVSGCVVNNIMCKMLYAAENEYSIHNNYELDINTFEKYIKNIIL